ncbi:MAG TPA: protein kinase [Urbifossiella sp.]|nr:protein kinase [Urbifossiella sp.]
MPATDPEPTAILTDQPAAPAIVFEGSDAGAPAHPDPRTDPGVVRFPQPGTTYLGFRLAGELGRGAFGRVYLAYQGDLAGRPVALKVAPGIVGESQTLAQLQHQNIVPVYSLHRDGPLQAVCMPYCGRVTLADVLVRFRGGACLPSSGRELRSTFVPRGEQTERSHRGDPTPHTPTPTSLPPLPPPPAQGGWAGLEGLSYVEAVVTLGGQLADGLGHAHDRGILHRDLKPANVLLADDGRAMLLDFNLAEDTKARGDAGRAAVGGTLAYMAPEQLRAFRDRGGNLDGRCDLYALGMVLFELLTGRHPFPAHRGLGRPALGPMLAAREAGAPSARAANRAVSPAVDAVVRKLLAPAPAARYQSARHLREDIDRHLAHRPLLHAPNPSARERAAKWARRHPRLASSGSVAAAAAVLLAAAGGAAAFAWDRGQTLHARVALGDHRADFAGAQLFLDDRTQSRPRLDEAASRLRAVLARYGVPEEGGDGWLAGADARRLPDPDRARLRGDVGETLYLLAEVEYQHARAADAAARAAHLDRADRLNAAAAGLAGDRIPRAAGEQRAAVADLRGDAPAAAALRTEAAGAPADSARDQYLAGAALVRQGRFRDGLPPLRRSTYLDPGNLSAWFVRGTAHAALDQFAEAIACFSACLALRDDFAPAWLNRGLARAALGNPGEAADDFTRAIALDPRPAAAHAERASARQALGDPAGAEADLTRALEAGGEPVRLRLLRAVVRRTRGDADGARADREEGLRQTPGDEAGWVARGVERLAADPPGALADADKALEIDPFSVAALQLKAHVLGERLGRPDAALAVLDRAVELHPDYVPVRAGRAVELARRGRRDAAHADARAALLRDTRPANLYQVGCVFALTSRGSADDRREAMHLLWAAVRGGFGHDLLDSDPDLDPVRADPQFAALRDYARGHPAGAGRD